MAILIHIGLTKTGTSWFQQEIFPFVDSGKYLGKRGFNKPISTFADEVPAASLKTPADYVRLINSVVKDDEDESIRLISDEVLYGYGMQELISAFSEVDTKVGILITVRNQRDWILSRHNNNVIPKFKRWAENKRFLNTVLIDNEFMDSVTNAVSSGDVDDLLYGYIDYNSVVLRLAEHFPVYVLPFESVLLDAESSLGMLEEFLSENFDDKLGFDIERANRMVKKPVNKSIHSESFSSKAAQDAVVKRFADTNKKLAELIGVDLGAYGYY